MSCNNARSLTLKKYNEVLTMKITYAYTRNLWIRKNTPFTFISLIYMVLKSLKKIYEKYMQPNLYGNLFGLLFILEAFFLFF